VLRRRNTRLYRTAAARDGNLDDRAGLGRRMRAWPAKREKRRRVGHGPEVARGRVGVDDAAVIGIIAVLCSGALGGGGGGNVAEHLHGHAVDGNRGCALPGPEVQADDPLALCRRCVQRTAANAAAIFLLSFRNFFDCDDIDVFIDCLAV
jgi:hypothetical protein